MKLLNAYQNQIIDVQMEITILIEQIILLDELIENVQKYNEQLKREGSWFSKRFKKKDVIIPENNKEYDTNKLREKLVLLKDLQSGKKILLRNLFQ